MKSNEPWGITIDDGEGFIPLASGDVITVKFANRCVVNMKNGSRIKIKAGDTLTLELPDVGAEVEAMDWPEVIDA